MKYIKNLLKHLKVYEKYNESKKNYAIVCLATAKVYWIIEIVEIYFFKHYNYKWIKFIKLYSYRNNIIDKFEVDIIENKPYEIIKDRIKFQYNNLQDCLETLNILVYSDKYNL